MHVAASAFALRHLMNKIVDTAFKLPNESYIERVKEIQRELGQKYISPNVEFYSQYFHSNNSKMLKKRITDWNHLVYPDALFAEKVYEGLKSKDQ